MFPWYFFASMINLYSYRNGLNLQNQNSSLSTQVTNSQAVSSNTRTNNPITTSATNASSNRVSSNDIGQGSYEENNSTPTNSAFSEIEYISFKLSNYRVQSNQLSKLYETRTREEQSPNASAADKKFSQEQKSWIEQQQRQKNELIGFWEKNINSWTQEAKREMPNQNTLEFKKISTIREKISSLENDYDAIVNEETQNPQNLQKQAIKDKIDGAWREFNYADNTNASLDKVLNILGVSQEQAANYEAPKIYPSSPAVRNTNNTQVSNQTSISLQNTSSTEDQSTNSVASSIKSKIAGIQKNANARRAKQLKQAESSGAESTNRNNDSTKAAQANCPARQGGTTNQESLTIQTHKDIDKAKKILQEIKQSNSLSSTEKQELSIQLKTAFETMDSFFQLEQQLLNSSVQKAESRARADRSYADGMSARERRQDKGAANEQARLSEIRLGDSRADLTMAQSNKMQVASVLQSINSSLLGYETSRIFNRG